MHNEVNQALGTLYSACLLSLEGLSTVMPGEAFRPVRTKWLGFPGNSHFAPKGLEEEEGTHCLAELQTLQTLL